MKIYLMRHAQTAGNLEKRLQGRSDAPLTDAGIEQARDAGRRLAAAGLSFDVVYASPLLRARQTAGIVCPGVDTITDERLLEMDYGPYEGCSLTDPPQEVSYFFQDFIHHRAPEGMESLSQVTDRLGDFLEELKEKSYGGALIVTHAIAMKGALEYLTPLSKGRYWSKYIGNCSIYVSEYDGGVFKVPEEWGMQAGN